MLTKGLLQSGTTYHLSPLTRISDCTTSIGRLLLNPFKLYTMNTISKSLSVLAFAVACALQLTAQNFTLAPGFGSQGAIYNGFGEFENNYAHTLLPSNDGKLILGATGFGDFGIYIKLVKFSPLCGSLDNSFGNGGKVYMQFDSYTYFNRFKIQPDGKIVGVGLKAPGGAASSFLPFVCRLNADGSIDSSFNNQGYFDQRFDPISSGELFDLHLYPNGNILGIGNCRGNINGGIYGIGLLRFLPDGQLDTSFANGGKMVLPFYGGTPVKGVVTESGDIYVTSRNEGASTHKIYKYFNSGEIDTAFGPVEILTNFGCSEAGLHMQGDKLLFSADLSSGLRLVRLNLDGTIDSTFGNNGVFEYGAANNFNPRSVFVNEDQSILIGGREFNLTATALKLTADGAIDSSFGTLGFVRGFDNMGGSDFSAGFGAIYMPNDSTFFAAGHVYITAPNDLYAAKYISGADNFTPFNFGPNLNVCNGTTIELNPGTYENYLWNDGSNGPVLNVTQSGTYSVTVADANGCGGTDSVSITFNAPFVPEISLEGNVLTASGEGTFSWLLNGEPIPNETGNALNVQGPGAYSLAFTDTNGCISFSNAVIITSVNEVSESFIRTYPNPASTELTIDYGNFALMSGYQLRIENSLGQQVFQTNINQQSDTLSLATWGGNGLYFVHIVDPQGNTIDIRKIVLQ